MVETRPPLHGDINAIIAMAKTFQQNSLYKDCGFDKDKVFNIILQSMDPNSNMFMVVGLVDGKILGAFCGNVTEYYFSRQKIASDLAVYVNPDDRRFAYKFLNKAIADFEAWAKQKGAREICIAGTSGAYGPAFEKYLQKQNYTNVGFITKKGI